MVLASRLINRAAAVALGAILLAFVAGVYQGFAVLDSRARAIAVEAAAISVFLLLALLAIWTGSVIPIGAGFIAHGLWDVAHHPKGISTLIKGWYAPFCLAYDWGIAVFLLVWLR